VQRMVAALLGLSSAPESDHAADALALAICHANQMNLGDALEASALTARIPNT